MNKNILITGGAGFIGTHLTRRLLREGCNVSVLDNFSSQVHAGTNDLPADLRHEVRLLRGDVRNRDVVRRALKDQDVVVHLAAETGTGQSMYEVSRYQATNIGGTATLLDCLVNSSNRTVQKIVLASSRAVYGEGQFRCEEHGTVYPGRRKRDSLWKKQFDPPCPECGRPCLPEPTTERSPLQPLSFYGLTKQVQENMLFMFAQTCGISTYALRYQNVYGPGQSLTNPYTGILAIFSNLARSRSPILIFEDGQESRDFIFVGDVVQATWHFISEVRDLTGSFNVGTGERTSVLEVAKEIVRFFGSYAPISITGTFREGDIRHNCADLSRIRAAVGFMPQTSFSKGLPMFLDWVESQDMKSSHAYESSLEDMVARGLLHG